jgi:ribosomal protein S18 acetylase RimI-like enzyme
MPKLTNRTAVRALLETDRAWAVYPLGDLAPGYFEKCDWFGTTGDKPGLILLYRGFTSPIFFALGEPDVVRMLLDKIDEQQQMYLHVPPNIVPLLRTRYDIRDEKTMWRMLLDESRFRAVPTGMAIRLGLSDLADVERLYADGKPAGETPHFFFPEMLQQGVFFGIREGRQLIAAAGTHLVAPEESVAAIGNIYTRRDRRGRGLASQVTSAVTGELLRREIRTIALNVHEHNHAAIRVYERLGFMPYCTFIEALAIIPQSQNGH